MTKSFNTRPALTKFAEGLTLIAMAGLTFASAAALASAPIEMVEPVVHQLPTVEITVKKHQLPAVVMTVKRSHTA
ncbi:hypothetical protein [Inhella sp.]|uniref:hypothetical protein n=1 Tax=Inhella sp. TaxID=1921806 RepID=UPI0035B17C3E